MWVRGLKQSFDILSLRAAQVAPRVGAWIETKPNMFDMRYVNVAPRVGAWIETFIFLNLVRS